jgi:hypothetical protein
VAAAAVKVLAAVVAVVVIAISLPRQSIYPIITM